MGFELFHMPTLNLQKTIENSFRRFFATSADVVMEASGLRIEAIRVIAREQGVEIEDTACRCIDENLLASLGDAHVRRLKVYFNNAKRHVAELGGDELATFVAFCKTFKKRQSSDSLAQSWSDIDVEAIKEQFIHKVHELTPSPRFDIFGGCGLFDEVLVEPLSLQQYREFSLDEFKERDEVMIRVLKSTLHNTKPVRLFSYHIDFRNKVRKDTLSARYHIYTSEEDDHNFDTICNYIINRGSSMVA